MIRYPSISSTSNLEISDFVAEQLADLGFQIELIDYDDAQGVPKRNVVARRDPITSSNHSDREIASSFDSYGGIAYFAHTDVVPADGWVGSSTDESNDSIDPFEPQSTADRIYGRGACDMKGSLAAMISAVRAIDVASQSAPIWITATADEEVGFAGAHHVANQSEIFREMIDSQPLAIIGEPTELQLVHAHKGITGFEIVSHGRAAHSSSDDGVNANDKMIPLLHHIREIGKRTRKDSTLMNESFDPAHLSWNYGVSDSMSTLNITPPRSRAWVSFRPMPGIDGQSLITEVCELARSQGLEFRVFQGGPPLWTDPESPVVNVLAALTDSDPITVCYGTDGCVFSELAHRVVLGPGSIKQAHTFDEWISFDQMDRGVKIYEQILRRFATNR